MSMDNLFRELDSVGRRITGWEAQRRTLWAAALWLAVLWLFTLTDVFVRLGRPGRVLLWLLAMAGMGAAVWYVIVAIRRRLSPDAVAVCVERTFPELDNHLINCVQFAESGRQDYLVDAYLSRERPDWAGIRVDRMRDRKALGRAAGAVGLSFLLTAVALLWSGAAWGNSLLRVLNPFSNRAPSTLATILEVQPGNSHILTGSALAFRVTAAGKGGQRVFLDLWPADDRKNVVEIGRLGGTGDQEFSYAIPKLTTDLRYRVRAGDAVSDSYRVKSVTPPAFRSIGLKVTPPAYTRLPPRTFDGLADVAVIPAGSRVDIEIEGDRELAAATAQAASNTVELAAGPKPSIRAGAYPVRNEDALQLVITDAYGYKADAMLRFEILPDRPPAIRILSPASRSSLGPGAMPRIQWEVTDDYGLTSVALEQVTAGKEKDPARAVQQWSLASASMHEQSWNATERPAVEAGQPLAYRLVAFDTSLDTATGRAQSPVIYFDTMAPSLLAKAEDKVYAELTDTLSKLVDLQKDNLEKTVKFSPGATNAAADAWAPIRTAQEEIRAMAGRLIGQPGKPLGTLESIVRTLHDREMREAVDALARGPVSALADRPALAQQAARLQTRILQALSVIERGVAKVREHKEITGLLALLDALVAGQEETFVITSNAVARSAAVTSLAERQDKLAGDVPEFVRACRKEVEVLARSDTTFSALVAKVADQCEEKKIPATMLTAAEHLDNNKGSDAMPLQTLALAQLKELQALLNQWRTAEAKAKAEELAEVIEETRDKFEKLTSLQSKIVDGIRQTLQQKDKSDKAYEEMASEIGEAKDNMADVLLKIATDLQVFPELPVGNDLVTDVSQIYEEVKQVEGSAANETTELGLQKEDFILKLLEEATDRVDDVEMWLAAEPDTLKRNIESFDKQELPQIPVIPMASEMQDIIGDLLEQQKEEEDKADDSAGNQGAADMVMGWKIAEGEYTSYAAKGKSGNERPDHKEQDGRSLVGRQGMSDGETTAGSGKVNAGDENIEARRTQDSAQSGEVQEEGHSEAKATGGGKQSGFSERLGMAGTGPRRDANTSQGSPLGMQSLLRRNAEALYARASMAHLRTGSLDEAVQAMRQAEEALQKGYPIREVREYQRRAVAALKKAQTELGPGVVTEAMDVTRGGPGVQDQVSGAPDEAPAEFRDLVSEYFKSLNEVSP